jgi:hypothetical protein
MTRSSSRRTLLTGALVSGAAAWLEARFVVRTVRPHVG